MSTVKVGIGAIHPSKFGSVELPPEITLACPRCGELAVDQGQCKVEMFPVRVPDTISKSGYIVRLQVDCRSCGCPEGEPAWICETEKAG